MKKLLILLMLSVSVLTYAQEKYRREGNTFVVVKSTKKSKSSSKETEFTVKDTDGKTYKVYISKNGKTYINKISKKSGKTYRKYVNLENNIK